MQFNTDALLGWLVFDVDHEDSFEVWDRANVHPPNLYVQNPDNGHGHLLYALATPVGTCDSHRRAPIELAATVQRGMTRRLCADPAYANRLAKNPLHPRWRKSWLIGEPFDLTEAPRTPEPRGHPPLRSTVRDHRYQSQLRPL